MYFFPSTKLKTGDEEAVMRILNDSRDVAYSARYNVSIDTLPLKQGGVLRFL
jgi:hypothetical protein